MAAAQEAQPKAAAAQVSSHAGPACDRAAYYIVLGQYDSALRQLDGARASGNSSAANENLRGVALMMSGHVAESAAVFDGVVRDDPALIEARFNRGVAELKLGQPARASADFEAIANDERSMLRASAAYHNALALDRLGRSAEASEWIDRAIALDNDFDAARLLSGVFRERSGDLTGAARIYLDYLKRHPDSTVAMLRLGVSAQRAGRADVAATYLKRVIAEAPDSIEAVEARKFLVLWE